MLLGYEIMVLGCKIIGPTLTFLSLRTFAERERNDSSKCEQMRTWGGFVLNADVRIKFVI